MKDTVYLDASFLIALQIKNHPKYSESLKISKKIKDKNLYVSYLSIDEYLNIMKRYFDSKKMIIKTIKNSILSLKNTYVINPPDSYEGIKAYMDLWNDSKIRPRDALHLFIMKKNKISNIATFDENFSKRL